ncbi:hypothetical protein TNCV_4804241 [Trichonephila clavipes]|nr:hypothetical protein TNCV_4804241 [Trichonephila clavipes]
MPPAYRSAKASITPPDVYMRLSEVRSSLCTDIYKMIPKALEDNKWILTVFCERLTYFRERVLLVCSFSRAFGDGPRSFEPWSSDVDDT